MDGCSLRLDDYRLKRWKHRWIERRLIEPNRGLTLSIDGPMMMTSWFMSYGAALVDRQGDGLPAGGRPTLQLDLFAVIDLPGFARRR